MKINGKRVVATAVGLSALALACAALGACHSSASNDKLAAARQALQATGQYQIVAQDAERGLLTVRSMRDGSLQLIDVNAPPSAAAAPTGATASVVGPASAATAPSEGPAAQSVAGTDATEAGVTPTAEASSSTAAAAATDGSNTLSSGTVSALNAAEGAGHGLVLAHGPRIHIERVSGPAAAAAPVAATAKTTDLSGISINHAVICREGERMRLQQVRVVSPSVGIVLQPGCQLELLDSDVQSGNIALVVNAGANLRIENSTINGRIGSLQASNATRVSSWASDFTGPTLLEGAEFIDRGGNTWQ